MWFCAMSATVSGLSTRAAVERAGVQQHADEGDVIARRAVEPAAAHVEFGLLRKLEGDRARAFHPRRAHAWKRGERAGSRRA